jgi:N6-adenosine-specific RNA methylase IME4
MNYSIFMIDPPWPKLKGGLRKERPNQGRILDYDTMSVNDIFKLLDSDILSKSSQVHCIFMWTVEQFLIECEEYMKQRQYKRHCRFVWDKTNGVAPAFTVRYSHEYMIWYYKPKLLSIANEQRGKFKTVFQEHAREHSRKPEYAYKMIESFYPFHKKFDVFSRQTRIGWDQFGDESLYF